jgi:hypothetical protein
VLLRKTSSPRCSTWSLHSGTLTADTRTADTREIADGTKFGVILTHSAFRRYTWYRWVRKTLGFVVTSSRARGLEVNGAQKRTRTSTTLRSPAPEAGASTNSAIWARGRSGRLAAGWRACQPRRPAPRQILFQSRGFVALARPAPPFALAPSGASRHGDARDAAASGFENRQDRQG